MKKLIGLFMLAIFSLVIFSFASFADSDIAARRAAQLKLRTNVIQYKKSLQQKLASAKQPARKKKLTQMIRYQDKRITIINERLRKLTVELPTAVTPVAPKAEKVARPYEIGGGVGLIAGGVGVRGDAVIKVNPKFDVRVGAGYTQGNNTNPDSGAAITRKYAFTYGDAIYRIKQDSGLNALYLGAGLNYLNYTSGQYHGEIGYQVFVGGEKIMGSGLGFAEIGLSNLRTGFTADLSGVSLLVGYKIPVVF